MRVWCMCCFSCCCFCYCATVLWPSLLLFCCLQLFKHMHGGLFLCVCGSWNEVEVLPFSVGVLPHPCLSTLLWICTTLFAFHVQLKGAAGVALWSWHSISETHLLFSEFPVLFLSILPPFRPSLSLSLI